MILIFFFQLKIIRGRLPHMVVVTCSGPKRWNTDVSTCWRPRGLHSKQSSIVGNRLMPEFQQYLKNGECQLGLGTKN